MNYLEQFNKILNDMLENSVTKAEVKDVIDKFAESLKKTVNDLDSKLSTHKSEVTSEAEKIRKEVKDVDTKLRGLVSESNNKLGADIKVQLNELAANVGYLSDFVDKYEGYDDEELRSHIEKVKGMIPEMPEAYDPTEVMEDIEELEKRIDELEKRPVGRGGGVSAMAVAAAMKYVFHTEAPVGDIDGVNTTYTVSKSIWSISSFTINGEHVAELPNFTYAGNTITFSSPIPAVYAGKDIEVKYIG